MYSFFKNLFNHRVLRKWSFLLIVGAFHIHAREWIIKTNEIVDLTRPILILKNSLKICVKHSPLEYIIDVIPKTEFQGNNVILKEVVCVSLDGVTVPTHDMDLSQDNRMLTLDQLPTDIFSLIGKDLSASDVVNLCKVNKNLRQKVHKMSKRMRFVVKSSKIEKEQAFDNVLMNLFSGSLVLDFDLINIENIINKLPANVKNLSTRTSIGFNYQINKILEAINPEHFRELREIGLYSYGQNISLHYLLRFPHLVGFGTNDSPIILSIDDFNSLPKFTGDRLVSLNIGYIKNTSEQIINVLNGLPLLQHLYLSHGEIGIILSEQDIIKLQCRPLLTSLKMSGHQSGVKINELRNFINFISKFPNLKTFWVPFGTNFKSGIPFYHWNKLERFGASFKDYGEFWRCTLPEMKKLKVLSVDHLYNGEDYEALEKLPFLEKLEFRGEFMNSHLERFNHSYPNSIKSNITELSIDASCLIKNNGRFSLNKDFLMLIIKFPNLKILYSKDSINFFQECREIISLVTHNRVQLISNAPDFFEDSLAY